VVDGSFLGGGVHYHSSYAAPNSDGGFVSGTNECAKAIWVIGDALTLTLRHVDEVTFIAVVSEETNDTSMYILSLFFQNTLSPCLTHPEFRAAKQHSIAVLDNATFVGTFQCLNAKAFAMQIEVYEHFHGVSFQEI
jgi:hypothetical protein